jgi:NADH-quinone oxidoreductase subunit F
VASLAALKLGVEKWREYGTEKSPGTKLFCLSGHVNQPGIYEVPFGKTIRELISLAGGVPGGRDIQAVLVGGAAGVFVGPDMLNMRLTYEDSRSNNVPLGSGVIMVFNEETDMRPVLQQIGHFFAHESCGKCFPCQIGTQRQLEILDRIATNGAKPSDRADLSDIGLTMTETSLCGLGQTAGIAIKSAMKLWPEIME